MVGSTFTVKSIEGAARLSIKYIFGIRWYINKFYTMTIIDMLHCTVTVLAVLLLVIHVAY